MYRCRGMRQAAASLASAVVMLLVPAGRARGQSGGTSPVTIAFDNGLSVVGDHGDNEFQLGGLVQLDGRFARTTRFTRWKTSS